MAFIPLPNTIKVVFEYTVGGQLVVNVYFVSKPSPWSTGDMGNALAIFDGWHNTTARTHQSASLVLNRIVATDQSTQNAPGLELAVAARPGTIPGEVMPNNVTLVTTFNTAFRGRSFRGRSYWNGMAEAQVAGSLVLPATVTAINNTYPTLQTSLGAASMTLVVASRFTNNAPRITGLSTPVTGFRTENVVDSQRRRLPGRGR